MMVTNQKQHACRPTRKWQQWWRRIVIHWCWLRRSPSTRDRAWYAWARSSHLFSSVNTRVIDVWSAPTSKFRSIDRLASGAISASEITTLKHELGNDTMEHRSCVAIAILTRCELTEITCRLWDDIVVEFEHNPASVVTADLNVELVTVRWLVLCDRKTSWWRIKGFGDQFRLSKYNLRTHPAATPEIKLHWLASTDQKTIGNIGD